METWLALVAGAATLLTASAQGDVTGAAMAGTMEGTFTKPRSEFTDDSSGCTDLMKGCTGMISTMLHDVAGTIIVQDDCTFFVDGWQFDGKGPAVEWWGAKQSDAAPPGEFPYKAQHKGNPQKIGELGAPETYQLGSKHGGDSEVVVRLGKDAAGSQILLSDELNYISVWCEDYMVDFGSAALDCDAASSDAAEAAAPVGAGDVDVDENAPDNVPAIDDVLGDRGSDNVPIPGEASESASLAVTVLTGTAGLLACLL